jgi:hypothetical protein
MKKKNTFKNFWIVFTTILLLQFSLFHLQVVFAGPLTGETRLEMGKTMINMSEEAGFETPTHLSGSRESLPVYIANIIKIFLALLGIIFTILIIYGGYTWMTAGGSDEKIQKAKDTIQRAVIGFVIVMSAYAITHFVFKSMSGGGTTGGLG